VDVLDALGDEDAHLLLGTPGVVPVLRAGRLLRHQKGSSSLLYAGAPVGSLGTGRPPPPPPPKPPPPPPPASVRSLRCTSAWAQRRLGPISSAMTSTTERFSPCWVS